MKNSTYSDLCRTFRELAAWTWNKLGTANRLGISFNEETITESLLLKLAERHTGRDLTIHAYTKNEEGNKRKGNGADWSFWVANQAGYGKELRIQAKRLFPSGEYESLDGRWKNTAQIAKLLKSSNQANAIPLYVFYNGPFRPSLFFPYRQRYCLPEYWRDTDWGCSFAPLTAIPPEDKPTPDDVNPMKPWHCLVCECPSMRGTKTGSLPERMVSVLKEIYEQTEEPVTADPRFEGAKAISFELSHSPPAWVKLLKAAKSDDDNEPSETNVKLDQYLDEHGLKGVVFIQEIESEKPR